MQSSEGVERQVTTFNSLKRFVFVIEGLAINQDDSTAQGKVSPQVLKDQKALFREFKPLYLNKLTRHENIKAL